MKKWRNERFINHRDWILDRLKDLSLTIEEAMVVLMIDLMNEHQILITHSILANRLKKDSNEIDDILPHLSAKGYLALQFQNGKILFNVDGVFADSSKKSLAFDQFLFDLFESEFDRPLSQMELQHMAGWLKNYERELICYALHEVLTYDHKSFDYIERILVERENRDITAGRYEEGERWRQRTKFWIFWKRCPPMPTVSWSTGMHLNC